MIPVLDPAAHLPPPYDAFLRELLASGFRGPIETRYGSRLAVATDNSVYQQLPAAVVFPLDEADVVCLLRLANEERFRPIKLGPRGGGTGTNGQSLCDGVIVDVSRHQASILELDLEAGWVRVQPGVVLDQLNDALRPHGCFFAPNLSPSSRATIGGMINTDASGKGSRIYGKTSQHVLRVRAVLMDGTALECGPLSEEELQRWKAEPGLAGEVHRVVDAIATDERELIERSLPKLERFLTGYDLAHVRDAEGRFNLAAVLAGSEGTLGILTEATLRLTPLPKHRALLAIRYGDFDAALRAANVLVQSDPGAIETIDDTIVSLARKDVIWSSVAHLIEAHGEPPAAAINLVEFESDEPDEIERRVSRLRISLDEERGCEGRCLGYVVVTKPSDIASLWTLRKKGVGLLGNAEGNRRPVPFVEDTAVPPEHLADYIKKFRQILDSHGLRYGMFGHVDVGCLHVRPALDLRDPSDDELLRRISDEVAALVKSFGGVLWAEHGKGFRSEYSPTFFGPELYEELRRVKRAFDPHNQLNPGKLATPAGSNDRLVTIDAVKRGHFDREIEPSAREHFAPAVNCNGNGACFDYHPDHVMCPSSKVTRDRIHSPKGRAGLLREWLRQASRAGYDPSSRARGESGAHGRSSAPGDFSHEVYDAMNGCLACRACATQCPIKVDIPTMRADFYAQYHSRYKRPLRDHFVAGLEGMARKMAWLPRLFNWVTSLSPVRWGVERFIGIVDTPALSRLRLSTGLRRRGAIAFSAERLAALDADEKDRTVLIAQDVFTSFYESNVALATYDGLTRLGFRVVFLPFVENGKALHIRGFMERFRRRVEKTSRFYAEVAKLGIAIVGIEPAVTLTYRDEYEKVLPGEPLGYHVELLQEFLVRKLPEAQAPPLEGSPAFLLFGHCTERTEALESQAQWQRVFERLGLKLSLAATGCCGMCGVYGHEAEHAAESRGLFAMSWSPRLPESREGRRLVLAQGHSCRSQVERCAGFVPRHPMEVLAELLPARADT